MLLSQRFPLEASADLGQIHERTTVRLWWNGIHNGLKIRRRKLASSNLASRTTKTA